MSKREENINKMKYCFNMGFVGGILVGIVTGMLIEVIIFNF